MSFAFIMAAITLVGLVTTIYALLEITETDA